MTGIIPRKLLFRWAGWFALANSIVLGLVSLRYFGGEIPAPTVLSGTYLASVYISHHVLLTIVPSFVLLTPFILLLPRRRVVIIAAVTLFACMIALMMLDSLLWSQGRFHINALTVKILGWQSWLFTGVIFVIGLFFESMLARIVWNWTMGSKRRHGLALGTFIGLMIVVSQGIHAWADASYYVPVTSLGAHLPVYRGVTAKSFMTKTGLVDVKEARKLARQIAQSPDSSYDQLLNYPLNPLQCAQGQPLNLLIIVADAMRGSSLSSQWTPNIRQFAAEKGMDFRNHFSGGNSSRMGIFSLFYGLPPVYWNSFSALQKPSLLIDVLQNQGYQPGIFSSATLYRPVMLDRTAFARLENLRIQTEPGTDPAWKRDQKLTREWFEWLDARDPARPYFGFLFYDAPNVRSFPVDYPVQFQPEGEDELARSYAAYLTSVHFVDGLIGSVLQDLGQRGLLESTVVLITSDHGEEFGESEAGLEKHGSGYTRQQLVTPMVLHWPGRERGVVYGHRTSHNDIVPTLMQDLLGCTNPASDYSIGNNLFNLQEWDWLVAGSYYNHAVLEPDQITVTFPNGTYEVRDWNYRLSDTPQFRGDVLEAVSEQNTRYFRE